MNPPLITFAHLSRLSDATGLFEHAKFAEPRPEHGYCVDDVARGLVVTSRAVDPDAATLLLARTYLDFLRDAQVSDGRIHNRRGIDRAWQDEPSLEDCWGRSLWGLGSAVASSQALGNEALDYFNRSVDGRSPWSRTMAFAALGAAEVLKIHPLHPQARSLLRDAAVLIGTPSSNEEWRWPEDRLSYANAALAETLLAAGSMLDEPQWVVDGLAMLAWLVDVETTDGGHLSVTPVGGWALGEPRPGFDQQPIEVAALADACARALDLTADVYWREAIMRCSAWFGGANDVGIPLADWSDGSGCDGLECDGRNENRGAESTLAMLSTVQQAQRVLVAMS